MKMNILILNGLNNQFPEIHYLQVMQRTMNNESEKDKTKEYNLKGIQVHHSCTRLLLDSPNKFDTTNIDDVPIQKLFITNLAKKTTQEELSKFFQTFGKVEECVIKQNKKSNYAFVTFSKVESALQALRSTSRLHEKELTVIPADSRHQPGYPKKEKKIANELRDTSTEPPSFPSSSTEVYPLVHRISDNCLMNIFQNLPIVDRVRVEGVCRRWRDLSLDSWRTLRRLDVNSSSWGCKSAEIGTSDLYQVLKRCGRFITTITFFEQNRMMSLRTLFIIGKLCPYLKIAYLGTLEVTPREIFFLLSQCPDLEFLEFDSYHFSDRDFSEIFAKSKKLKYVSFEESKIDGSCFINLPEEIETIVFHEPMRGVNHLVFHSAIQRLKNLQNLYLSVSHNDDYNSFDFGDNEMRIPVFDDRDANDSDGPPDDFVEDADDNDLMDEDREDDDDENSDLEKERVFQDIMIMMNETENENNPENNFQVDENLEWGQNPEPSAKKEDTDPNEINQSEMKEGYSAKKEGSAWSTYDDFNDKDESYEKYVNSLFAEFSHEDEGSFDNEEDFNDISSTITDVPEQKEDKQGGISKDEDEAKLEKTDIWNSKTTDSKISDIKTSVTKVSDSKTSETKTSDSKTPDTKTSDTKTSDSKTSDFKTSDSKEETNGDKTDEESGSNGKENDETLESLFEEEKVQARKDEENDSEDGGDDDNYEDVDEDEDEYCGADDDPGYDNYDYDYVNCDADDDFFVDYDNYDDYDDYEDYDDYDDYDDDDGFDVENDFEYESNLADTIKETIRNCNKNLKVLQLRRCNPAGLTSEDLIANFTNFSSLERLDISKMKIVNDELLSAVGANCPKLSVLVINACDSVTDTGIGGIALLPELKHLSMSDLSQVTGKQLETICSLKTLYCARCVSLQEEGINQLILNSQELEQLDVQMCKFISNSVIDIVLVAIQSRTNNIKLRIFAKGSSVDVSKIETKSELLEILMERRCEERDSFVDGDLGTEETGLSGDLRLRDFRGMIFESSTSDKDKED